VDGTSGGAVDLAAGLDHTCAVQAGSGAVVCWGANNFFKATPPSSLNGVAGSATSVSVGDEHSCALQVGGQAVCWGHNIGGRLTPPTDDDGLPLLFSALSAGPSYTCAIETSSLRIRCWGAIAGEPPETVLDPVSSTAVPFRAATLSSGESHVCATLEDSGGVVCFPGGLLASSPPLGLAASALASGVNHTVAIALPEPGSTALGLAGLGSLICLARRRRCQRVGAIAGSAPERRA
jgi:hypothetical protein